MKKQKKRSAGPPRQIKVRDLKPLKDVKAGSQGNTRFRLQ
jgi:hypothetical protein